jgi:hypothetical protein
MLGQKYYGFYYGYSDIGGSHDFQIFVDPPAKVLIEVALTRVNDIDGGNDYGFFSQMGIQEVHSSQAGTETFDPALRQAILRDGVDFIQIRAYSDNAYTRGRVLLNYW